VSVYNNINTKSEPSIEV